MSQEHSSYRLVGLDGNPHPVLDTPYESIDSAIMAAQSWHSNSLNHINNSETIGIEVSTSNGSWRTVGYA